jgi:ribosomal protein S18 acetylase RimI-like enzyme
VNDGVVHILTATTDEHWAVARRLVEDYAASLGIDLSFQDFQHEIASLRVEYGPPGGTFLLADHDDSFVGCGAFRRLTHDTCEMKRLYVAASGRARGIGRALAVQLIADARACGYVAMRLDTLPTMTAARHMYAALGFREIPAYRYNPVEGTTFMELAL